MGDTPPQIVWQAHGSPVVDGCVEASGRCFVCCGEMVRGMLTSKVLGKSFTDHARVKNPSGSHICEACCCVMSRTSPVLGRDAKDGKKFGANFRMHFGHSSINTCAPIGWWTGIDVLAYLVDRRLPIHPAYACTMGGLLDPRRIRVASLGGRRGDGMGRAEWEQRYYREELATLARTERPPPEKP